MTINSTRIEGPSVSITLPAWTDRIVRLTGHEIQDEQRNIPKALDQVLSLGDIKLDQLSSASIQLMLDELQFAKRFRGEPTFAEGVGEESATHSLQTMLLGICLLNSAIAYGGDAFSELCKDELTRIRTDLVVSLAVHDMGEVLVGEFSTVRTRAVAAASTSGEKGHTEETSAELERLIFERTLTLALDCVEHEGADFQEKMKLVRNEVAGPENITLAQINRAFDQHQVRLSDDAKKIQTRLIELYDAIEGNGEPTPHLKFVGIAGKILERIQGEQHILRLARQGEGRQEFMVAGIIRAPWPLTQPQVDPEGNIIPDGMKTLDERSGNLVLSEVKRLEIGLADLCAAANTLAQKAIVPWLVTQAYMTAIEALELLPERIEVPGKEGTTNAINTREAQRRYLEAMCKSTPPIKGELLLLLRGVPSSEECRELDKLLKGMSVWRRQEGYLTFGGFGPFESVVRSD